MFTTQDLSSSQGMVDALASLIDLKSNTSESILRQRTAKRIEIQTEVTARPGNSSERLTTSQEGVTGDISRNGCQIIFPTPTLVGDIYWLEFNHPELALGKVLARCLRCRYIREDAFETGFKFFEDIDLGTYQDD